MATAPDLIAQDSEEVVDELTSALEVTKETDEVVVVDDADADKVVLTAEEEAVKVEADTKAAAEEAAAAEEEVDPRDEEVRNLRSILREQKKDLTLLKSRVERADKKATAALDEDDEALKDDLSQVEQLSAAIQQIGDEKGANLEMLADMMAETQKFSDVYDVCSKENFNDMFDAIGQEIAQQERISLDEAVLKAELTVWTQKNPYKYMYGMIKKYHPKYAEKEETVVVKPGVTKDKKVADAPASIAGMGGGDTSKSGWTAARIDALPEDELDTVPTDVYNKYLVGGLK